MRKNKKLKWLTEELALAFAIRKEYGESYNGMLYGEEMLVKEYKMAVADIKLYKAAAKKFRFQNEVLIKHTEMVNEAEAMRDRAMKKLDEDRLGDKVDEVDEEIEGG